MDFNLLNIQPQFEKFLIFAEMFPWFCPIHLVSVLFQSTGNLKCVLEVVEGTLPMCVLSLSCRTACSPTCKISRGGFLEPLQKLERSCAH